MATEAHQPSGPASTPSKWVVRHQVAAFLGLAFVLSWWPWPFTLANPDSTALVSFGPIIAAVVVAALAGGRSQVADLLRAIAHWRVHWSWYVIALAGPFLIAGLAAAAVVALGVVEVTNAADDFGWSTWAALPLLLLSTALVGGPLFEEPGWRGFLLPILQREQSTMRATATVGLIWFVWHLPLLISDQQISAHPCPTRFGCFASQCY